MTSKVWTVKDLPAGDVVTIQGKRHPLVGGKLRILRDQFPDASLTAEQVPGDPDLIVYRARVTAGPREATATGTASVHGDRALADSLHELAETRAIARALRFFGIGVDSTGAEEMMGRVPRPLDKLTHETPPQSPSDDPSRAQIQELSELLAALKKAGKPIPEYEVPLTARDAADLIEQFTTALQ